MAIPIKEMSWGHWWGDFKGDDDKSPGNALSLKLKHEYSEKTVLTAFYKQATVNSEITGEDETGYQLDLTLSTAYKKYFIDVTLSGGETSEKDDFYMTSIKFRW